MSQESEQNNSKVSIVIVDDHQIFRQGIESNLELHDDLEVIGQGGDGKRGLELVRELQPDIVILDINLPLMNGIQVIRQISSDHLPVKVVMLTAYDDAEQVMHAMPPTAPRRSSLPGWLKSFVTYCRAATWSTIR